MSTSKEKPWDIGEDFLIPLAEHARLFRVTRYKHDGVAWGYEEVGLDLDEYCARFYELLDYRGHALVWLEVEVSEAVSEHARSAIAGIEEGIQKSDEAAVNMGANYLTSLYVILGARHGKRFSREHIPLEGNVPAYVTLQQIAATVNRSKRTLEGYKSEMPAPAIKGGDGQPAEWDWNEIRPWLEAKFQRKLWSVFPADSFRRS